MQSRSLLILAAICCLACLAGALIPTAHWVELFNHPLRTQRLGHIAEATIHGAICWRIALALAAGLVPLLTWFLIRLAPRTTRVISHRSALAVITLLGAVIVGISLRAIRLTESFWYDEITTLLDYVQYGPGPIVANYFSQANHIGFNVFAWCSIELLGLDEAALRLPALLASILTILVVTLSIGVTARTGPVDAQQKVRLWPVVSAALLAAILPVLVLQGAEARGYSLMIFFSALTTYSLLRALRGEGPAWWVTWSLALALGSWCHLVTAMVGLGHLAWLAGEAIVQRCIDRKIWKPFIAATGLASVLTLTLYSPALPDIITHRREFMRVEGNEPTLFGPEGLHTLLQLGGAWSWWALPGLAAFIMGAIVGLRSPATRRLLGLSLCGLPVAFLLVTVLGSWTYARFLLFVMPGVVLAMSVGIGELSRRSRLLAGGLLACIVAASLADFLTRPPKQPLRDAIAYVAAHRNSDDAVAVVGLIDNVIEYYAVEYEFNTIDTGLLGDRLSAVLGEAKPRFVIVLYPQSVSSDRIDMLRRYGFTAPPTVFHGWVDWTNGDVLVYQRR